jgi:poly(A) polymerase
VSGAGLADLLSRPPLRALLEALNGRGEEARVVGGAVRNALLGLPVSDVDIATTAPPDEVMARAAAGGWRAVPTGVAHGTVTVLADGQSFEVTTLREDVETTGRHAVVRFGRSFEEDARRRDFTLNALSLTPDGRLHDPVGGLPDLKARRVCFIGEARQRIREDYLRILRLFRFHAAYGAGSLDREGLSAAIAERDGLAILSRERVRAEFMKLLAAPRAVEVVSEVADAGFLALILGAVGERGRLGRAVAAGLAPVERLAALAVLHAGDAERLREALRLSNEEAERLSAYAGLLASLKGRSGPVDGLEARRLAARFEPAALAAAIAILAGEPRPTLTPEGRADLGRFATGEEPRPVFPLRGADLVARGVPPGPRLGAMLSAARELWLAEGCPEGEGAAERLLATVLRRAGLGEAGTGAELA